MEKKNGWKFCSRNGDCLPDGANYRVAIKRGGELTSPRPGGIRLGKTIKGAGTWDVPGAVFRCGYEARDVLEEDEHVVYVSRLQVLEEVPSWRGYGPNGEAVMDFLDRLTNFPWFFSVGEPIKCPEWAHRVSLVSCWSGVKPYSHVSSWSRARPHSHWAVQDWAAARNKARDAAHALAGRAAIQAAQDAAYNLVRRQIGPGVWHPRGAVCDSWSAAHEAGLDAARDAAWAVTEILGGVEDGYFSRLMTIYQAGHHPCHYDSGELVIY